MIEIIPNWHPVFVNFTVALFSMAVGFYSLSYFSTFLRIIPKTLQAEFETVARWCLWVATIVTILTVIAGLHAFYTVKHDGISHTAMTIHRNWALTTLSIMLLLAVWSVWRWHRNKVVTLIFIISLLIGEALLLSTAWHGAELVFRYGLGVMSLPNTDDHNHHHGNGMMDNMTGEIPSMDEHDHKH